MSFSYQERSRKLRIVSVAYGYDHPLHMLFVYYTAEVVPGICSNFSCNNITFVDRVEDKGHCVACQTDTIQSVLVLSGLI